MSKSIKYFALFGLVFILCVVGIFVCHYSRVRVLSEAEIKSLLDRHLDKRYLAMPAEYAGFVWENEKYVLVVFKCGPDRPDSLCLKIVGDVAVNYNLSGDMPEQYDSGCSEHKITVEDITGDNVPEFVYYSHCQSADGSHCWKDWKILNLAKKEIIKGSIGGTTGIYPQCR